MDCTETSTETKKARQSDGLVKQQEAEILMKYWIMLVCVFITI